MGITREKYPKFDEIIRQVNSWDEFDAYAIALDSTDDKGDLFERLTMLYLETFPEYKTRLKAVWTSAELPPAVQKK